jgi:hypothetical protein
MHGRKELGAKVFERKPEAAIESSTLAATRGMGKPRQGMFLTHRWMLQEIVLAGAAIFR